MRLHTVVCLLVAAAGAASPTLAQPLPTERQSNAFASMAAPAILPLGALPSAQLTEGLANVELILEGTQDQGIGTAALGWKRGSGQYRVKFSSPINKSTKEATPFDITQGLPLGATFEFTASNLLWAQASDQDLEDFRQLCRIERNVDSCDIGDLSPAGRQEARRLLRFDDVPMYIGATIAVTNQQFDYLDTLLAPQSEDHRSVAGTFRIGRFSETFGFAFASWSYQEQFRPGGASQEICLPLENTKGTACSESVIGAPEKKAASILAVELRRFFSRSFAIAPSVMWDAKSEVTSISVPIYFLRNAEGGLTGGLRSNYRSDRKSVTLSLFVGTTLTVTP